MDNLTHSVVGLAVGEFIHRSLPPECKNESQLLRRRLLLLSCWLSSNFPDLDIALTQLLSAPLGYLLHHRGHTHTLLYVLPQAALISAVIWLCWPMARHLLKESAMARIGLVMSLGLGLVLHIAMDYLNSYGVHPFHPFDSRWFFGDMVFIVEPLFWVSFGVPMGMTVQRRWLRCTLIAALFGTIVFFTVTSFLAWASFACLVIVALVLGYIQHKANRHGRIALISAAAVSVVFIAIQSNASNLAKLEVAQQVKSKSPASKVLDSAMTAFPANPICWSFVSIESSESAGIYRLRRGVLSLAPAILPVDKCPQKFSANPVTQENQAAIVFSLEQEGDLKTLRELAKTNCHVEAWLRFARAPFIDNAVASDLRFVTGLRGNFTTMNIKAVEGHDCSRYIPTWGFPREDLLVGGQTGN